MWLAGVFAGIAYVFDAWDAGGSKMWLRKRCYAVRVGWKEEIEATKVMQDLLYQSNKVKSGNIFISVEGA